MMSSRPRTSASDLHVMSKKNLKRISNFLKLTGMLAVALSLVLGLADLKGYLRNKNRMTILNWVLHSTSGISVGTPAAKEFIKQFPPPPGEQIDNLTQLTKNIIRQEHGGIYNASINYMRKDQTRTSFVATLDDVRKWASKTPYPWIAWWLTLIGFIELAGNWFIERKLKGS
jgi:hypothetical protein